MGGRFVEVPPTDVDRWCRAHLGAGVAEELFRCGHLSTVIGARLTSGQRVVVKVREAAERLAACSTVHRILFERGFPCPEPLVGMESLGPWAASAEALVAGGELFPDTGREPEPFAESLARLVALCPRVQEVGSLDPPLPWAGWNHDGAGLWPWPDDDDLDLNGVDGPLWLDGAGRAARSRLARADREPVLGHGDWYTDNLRWAGRRLHVAFDWDSVVAANEPEVVGMAAAVYPMTQPGTEATIAETAALLEAYGRARGRPFDAAEREEAWAAGLWTRCFDAKKQFAAQGRIPSLTEEEASERRRRAGAG